MKRKLACGLLVLTAGWGCGDGGGDVDATAPPARGLSWERVEPPQSLPLNRLLNTAFLVVDGVYNTELTAPYDVFHHTPFHTKPLPGMEVFTVSPDGQPVTTFEGLVLVPHYSFETAPSIDILVVPSAEGSMDEDLLDQRMLDWVARTGRSAHFVISLCDGAFVLAAAGLLDGHVCTTFPGDQDRFVEMFPRLDLRRAPSFVHHDRMLTSQGGARSFDVAMYLVDHIYGEKAARGVGRGLIIDWPPAAEAMIATVVRDQ